MAATRTRRAGVVALTLLSAACLGLTACSGGGFASSPDEVKTVGADLATSIDDAVANAMQLSGSDAAIVGGAIGIAVFGLFHGKDKGRE